MTKIGVVCGLQSEAKAIRESFNDDRAVIRISGASAERAEGLANALCQQDVGAIISIGISGGLSPHLEPGDLVIGKEIITEGGERFACHPRGLDLLTRSHKMNGIAPSIIFGADRVIDSPQEKLRLFRETGAKSVDMESHGAARAAHRAGVAFLAIRAIADPADRALPPAAMNAVKPDGGVRSLSTLGNALRDPAQMRDLIQLGKDSALGLATLRSHLGGLLGVLLLGSNLV